jgi:hypothetical protein
MRIEFWIPNATNTNSDYVILIDYPLQQWLHERASILRHAYIACLVYFYLPRDFIYSEGAGIAQSV